MNECALWPVENVFVPLSNSVQQRAKKFLDYLTNLLKSLSRRRSNVLCVDYVVYGS